MAKTSKIVKTQKQKKAIRHRLAQGLELKDKQAVQYRNRCGECGRPRGYMRKFDLCRMFPLQSPQGRNSWTQKILLVII